MTTVSDLPSDEALIELAQARALALLEASLADTSRKEAASATRLSRLLADEAGRDLLLDLTDPGSSDSQGQAFGAQTP